MNQILSAALEQIGVTDLSRGVAIGDDRQEGQGERHTVRSPIDGSTLAELCFAGPTQVQKAIDAASAAFQSWRLVPAPTRGDLVRRFGEQLRARKTDLAT